MYGPGTPPPQPGQAPQKKGRGCLIALAIVGGVGLIIVAVLVFAVVRFMNSKEGKMITTVVGESVKIANEAQNAPGAHELLKAGCAQGMVMDMEKWEKLAQAIEPDASFTEKDFPARFMVVCNARAAASAPSCDEVKRTYLAAVPSPPGRFMVQVQITGQRHARCQNVYEADGTFVRELKENP